MIVILDYDVGNLLSIQRAVDHFGMKSTVSRKRKEILDASHLILPGVGAFLSAMNLINKYEITEIIYEYVKSGKPLLGTCLGMQMLMTESHEFGLHKGLNLLQGSVKPIKAMINPKNLKVKIPHIGWNGLYYSEKNKSENYILNKVKLGEEVYFVHSYVVAPKDQSLIVAHSEYADYKFPAIIKKNNIIGCQFHPEKSGEVGLKIFKNFLNEKR